MNGSEILGKLGSKAVFRVQDVERAAYCKRAYARLILSRLEKKGLVRKVMRNAYTTRDNMFVVASNIVFPSYVSFWSASYFMGYTEQIVDIVQVATTRKVKVSGGSGRIRFIPMRHFFGYRKLRTADGDIFMAEDEKLLIDALLRPRECGNFGEIEKMFAVANVSEAKMVGYLKMVGRQPLIKRAGFLLEKHRGVDVSGHFSFDRNYVQLDPFSKKRGRPDAKWRVKA